MELREVRTDDLSAGELANLRAFLDEAFNGRFDNHNWDSALGGNHVLAMDDEGIVAHASVVPRRLHFSIGKGDWSDSVVREVGYVEAVAVREDLRRRGIGTDVLHAINQLIKVLYGFGVLATGTYSFYDQGGWRRWQGKSFVFRDCEMIRTPKDDDSLMVLAFDQTDFTSAIACEWREGDVW
jgi:aminoglycoside 2'-N-acetyltransferase I